MLAVVVFPWAPATAIVRRRRLSSPSSSARVRTARPRSSAARRSTFSGPIALEQTTSTPSPAGRLAAAWPIAAERIPSAASAAANGESARSDPVTVAPSACAARA
jgi:hypothetical protein